MQELVNYAQFKEFTGLIVQTTGPLMEYLIYTDPHGHDSHAGVLLIFHIHLKLINFLLSSYKLKNQIKTNLPHVL